MQFIYSVYAAAIELISFVDVSFQDFKRATDQVRRLTTSYDIHPQHPHVLYSSYKYKMVFAITCMVPVR